FVPLVVFAIFVIFVAKMFFWGVHYPMRALRRLACHSEFRFQSQHTRVHDESKKEGRTSFDAPPLGEAE
ncbi:MAG: hypothetical protein KAI38_01085, partial [Candidatus Latescibacteria bacterium]|nr:hypothetical protein [Candidatus Latescibacterota bacterium]